MDADEGEATEAAMTEQVNTLLLWAAEAEPAGAAGAMAAAAA